MAEKKTRSGFFGTLKRWFLRTFRGPAKEMDIFEVEKLESPSRLAVKAFARRKLAMGALIVLILMFLLVFIGPLFVPIDLNYLDMDQANMAPTMSLRSVPGDLKGEILDIKGFANFTVGVSKDHKLYMWGNAQDSLTGVKFNEFPEEVKNGEVFDAAAGSDHVVAIVYDAPGSATGHLVMWGDKNRGQLGYNTGNEDDPVLELPREIREGTLDLSKVEYLGCGKQASVLIYDNKVYYWGNKNTCLNMENTQRKAENLQKTYKKAVFSNYYTILLCDDGTVVSANEISVGSDFFRGEDAFSMKLGKEQEVLTLLKGKKVVDIAASNSCFTFLTEDGDLLVHGASKYGEKDIVAIPETEKAVKLMGGSFHFAVVTDAGNAYIWGSNDNGQCDLNGAKADNVYTGSYQTYLVSEDGKLTDSCGLKGHLFGTDDKGRDTFARIIHGGKMTMTIGAVAVIISSIIAIIVGCISGYFGGWVDILLMRVTEIFAAIPFLPFAMMLSYVLTTRPLSETTRIFIIMCILGLLSWTGLAHMIRGQVLAEREKEFVLAAKAIGVKEKRIAFRHILPNVISVVLVSMTLSFAGCLLTESSLSYLGFGVQQPRPTWGNMLNGANKSLVIQNYWWQWVFPSIFLAIATICINIIGDALRDVLDPKSSQEK